MSEIYLGGEGERLKGFDFIALTRSMYLINNFTPAVVAASREIYGGIDYAELKDKCNRIALLNFADSLLQLTYSKNQDELVLEIDSKLQKFCCNL